MTYKLPRKGISSLGKTEQEPTTFWTLYRKDEFENKWVRASENVYYSERLAWHVFKDRLVNSPISLAIRSCKLKRQRAQGKSTLKHSRHQQAHFNPAKEMLASIDIEYLNGVRVA